MSASQPTFTNAQANLFQFGTLRMGDQGVIFQGAVVFGTGFTYDVDTGYPLTGMVHHIEVQTRIAEQLFEMHHRLPDIATTVPDLNATTPRGQAPWFDATDIIRPIKAPTTSLLQDEDLLLTTGDILTADDLQTIAKAIDPDPAIKSAPDLDGLDDIIVMLNITTKDIPQDTDLPDFTLDGFGDLHAAAAH